MLSIVAAYEFVALKVIFFAPTEVSRFDVTAVMLAVGVKTVEVAYVLVTTLVGLVKVRVKAVPVGAAGIYMLMEFEVQHETILSGYTILPPLIETENVLPSIWEG
jgi:hypothetical protein